jgi:hypothetical protein
VLIVWIAAIVVVPSAIGTAVYIDARLSIIPVMLYLSSMAFQPKLLPGPVLSVVVTSLAVIRILALLPSWELHDARVRSFRAMDDRIATGARVIVVASTAPGCGDDHSWGLLEEHLPSLFSIDRDAFVSTVFAADGMQPIRWKSNVRGLDRPNVVAPSWDVLENNPGWRTHYDYVALQGCLPRQSSLRALLPVARSNTWQVYAIVRPPAAPPQAFNEPTAHRY